MQRSRLCARKSNRDVQWFLSEYMPRVIVRAIQRKHDEYERSCA